MDKSEKKALTGIERQLVLEYLIDGNVPLTLSEVTPDAAAEKSEGTIKKISSGIFPVALKSEQMKVLDQGIILLQNPSESIKSFSGKSVKVQFYFNRLGLYFLTEVKSVSTGLAIVIPQSIFKVEDEIEKKKTNFYAVIYYETAKKNGGIDINCVFDDDYKLFSVPKWKDVPEENQKEAKSYIEEAVLQSKQTSGFVGNGVFLISVSRFLSEKKQKKQGAIDGRAEAPKIIYIDHERMVFASESENMILTEGNEYAVMLSFPISGPVKDRKVYLTCRIAKIMDSRDGERKCACAVFTSIKEEDLRFLYEKVSD